MPNLLENRRALVKGYGRLRFWVSRILGRSAEVEHPLTGRIRVPASYLMLTNPISTKPGKWRPVPKSRPERWTPRTGHSGMGEGWRGFADLNHLADQVDQAIQSHDHARLTTLRLEAVRGRNLGHEFRIGHLYTLLLDQIDRQLGRAPALRPKLSPSHRGGEKKMEAKALTDPKFLADRSASWNRLGRPMPRRIEPWEYGPAWKAQHGFREFRNPRRGSRRLIPSRPRRVYAHGPEALRLRREAEAAALHHGHALTEWAVQGNDAWAKCRKCDAKLVISPLPVPGGVKIGGTALALECVGQAPRTHFPSGVPVWRPKPPISGRPTSIPRSNPRGFEAGTPVHVRPTGSGLQKSYPAANWIPAQGAVVILEEYAPHANTLDVLYVHRPQSHVQRSIYDFNIVRKWRSIRGRHLQMQGRQIRAALMRPNPPRRPVIYTNVKEIVAVKGPGSIAGPRNRGVTFKHKFSGGVRVVGEADGSVRLVHPQGKPLYRIDR